MSVVYTFSIPDLRCVNCVRPVEHVLNEQDGISAFYVDLVSKRLTVTFADDALDINAALLKINEILEDIGKECVLIPAPFIHPPTQAKSLISRLTDIMRSHLFLGAFACVLGFVMLFVMLLLPHLSFGLMALMASVSVSMTLFMGFESYQAAWMAWRRSRTLTMDSLFTLSTLAVLAVSIAALWLPWLPTMFDAGLLIFGFRHLGRAIEASLSRRMALLVNFKDRAPPRVRLHGSNLEKDINAIEIGAHILLEPGAVIPLDGELLSEHAFVYDTIATGATLPQVKGTGAALLAGMRLAAHSPPLLMRVDKTVDSSYLSRLDKAIFAAESQKAPLETEASRLLQYFIPAVILLALCSGLVMGLMFSTALAIQCASAVLVSACPCTLGFIIPLVMKVGMRKGFDHGVHYKNGEMLERSAHIDAVVFDLNGTLTTGVPVVSHLEVADEAALSEEDFVRYLMLMEADAKHPVAKAICQYGQSRHLEPWPSDALEGPLEYWHSGVHANIDGFDCYLGNEDMMREAHISLDSLLPFQNQTASGSVIYFARAGVVLACIVLSDPLRQQALETVQSLVALGKSVHICTGADLPTAQRYAQSLGVAPEQVHASCVGGDGLFNPKAAYIQSLQQAGLRVAMVGDAGNDAPGVAASDFGMAMQSEGMDEMTEAHAGALLPSGALLPVVHALVVGAQTVKHIKQNLVASLTYNMLCVLASSGGLIGLGVALNPCIGAALMIVQTSLVLLHVYSFQKTVLDIPSVEGAALPAVVPRQSHELMHDLGLGPKLGEAASLNIDGPRRLAAIFQQPEEDSEQDDLTIYGHPNI